MIFYKLLSIRHMFILMVLALAAAYDSHTTVEEIEQEISKCGA